MAFSFTDRGIGDVLLKRAAAGVDIEGIYDDCLVDRHSTFHALRMAGLLVRRDGNQALMHHKVFVIDGRTVITGSFNFSQNAESANNEACVIITGRSVAHRYLQEFSRLRTMARDNRNLPPYDHPACRRGLFATERAP